MIGRMETLDSQDLFDASPRRSRAGHGGYREGAGRKGPGYVPPPEKVDYDKAKARSEAAKADLAELEYKIKSRQYVDRAAVVQMTTTAYATIAQTLRSIPDNLERAGVSPEICQMISEHMDEGLNELADQFEMLGGGDAPDEDEDADA